MNDGNLRIDGLDRRILALLRGNSRLSYSDLGKQVGLSASATKRRVDRLQEHDVIERFTIDIHPESLGWNVSAFIELYCDGQLPPPLMKEMSSTIPEVVSAYTVTGDADGILLVRAESMSHLEAIITQIRNHSGVARTRSTLVLSTL